MQKSISGDILGPENSRRGGGAGRQRAVSAENASLDVTAAALKTNIHANMVCREGIMEGD
jgi:hypothetical protein